ncbi:MAG: GNAT family N-acetyltransferase [Cyclobacteriaceae bacterium]|nr:GNAT family N-acetyltransferase [Cyclobacteriaceae bacterium]
MEIARLPDQFETQRLILQRLKYEDAEEIFYAYASKSEATRFVSWPTHSKVADTRRYLSSAIPAWLSAKEFNYTLRLKAQNKLIGAIGAVNDDGKIQIGYIISPASWNQGFATEACRALLGQLIKLPFVFKIWTFVDAENTASLAVLKKCGLAEEARLSLWHRFVNQDNIPKDCILLDFPLKGR